MNANWRNMYQNCDLIQQINNNIYNNQMMNNNMNFDPMNNEGQIRMMANFFAKHRQQMMENNNQNMNNNFNMNMNVNNNINNQNNNQDNNKKIRINIRFRTMDGVQVMMNFDVDNTVNDILTKFLKKCNLEEYIGKTEGVFTFLFSGQKLDFEDKRKIKDVTFANNTNIINILVIDTNRLIGA